MPRVTAEQAQQLALQVCLGSYQRNIVLGNQKLSGADLVGKAKSYGFHYKKSRERLLRRVEAANIPFKICTGAHGFLYLEWGGIMCHHCGVRVAAHESLLCSRCQRESR